MHSHSPSLPHVSFERERGVYAIQVTRDVGQAVIPIADDDRRSKRILQVFRSLSDAKLPIFLIKLHGGGVTLAFAGEHAEAAGVALTSVGFTPEIRRDLAIVAVRAASMRDLSGVMVTVSDALFSAGAGFYETGDSHDSVQVMIQAARIPEAVQSLLKAFQLPESAVEEKTAVSEAAR